MPNADHRTPACVEQGKRPGRGCDPGQGRRDDAPAQLLGAEACPCERLDVLRAVTAELPPVRRWLMRCVTMAIISVQFGRSMAVNVADLLRQDGIEPKSMRGAAWRYFVFGKPGVLRRILPHYLAWYRPGFHPWQKDDRDLLSGIEDSLVPAAAAA